MDISNILRVSELFKALTGPSLKDLAAGTGTVPQSLSMLLERLEKEETPAVEGIRIRLAGFFREEEECSR